MANLKSAIKRIRISARRTVINKSRRSRVRTIVRKSREALDGDDLETAQAAIREATSEIDRAAKAGTIHANAAARRKSRLMKALAAMAGKNEK